MLTSSDFELLVQNSQFVELFGIIDINMILRAEQTNRFFENFINYVTDRNTLLKKISNHLKEIHHDQNLVHYLNKRPDHTSDIYWRKLQNTTDDIYKSYTATKAAIELSSRELSEQLDTIYPNRKIKINGKHEYYNFKDEILNSIRND